ncbi:MAG: diphosphomevalonate decarboxylase [Gammaproteobacteria bacterium]
MSGNSLKAATAVAQPNIALVKYWGKRNEQLNLPAVGSLSITLDALHTRTRVVFDASLHSDRFSLNGSPACAARISACLDPMRALAGTRMRVSIETENDFPTAAGLASSAAGFAALVVAANAALGLELTPRALSMYARRGSGSAARSIFGGFVEMARGERDDGTDAVARPLLDAHDWPLAVVIAVTSVAAKAVGSTDGMRATAASSPYYGAWVQGSGADLTLARRAVMTRDFGALAAVSEHSCLKMHALGLAARPPLIYWNQTTVACMEAVRGLRAAGTPVFYTIDAGPQVKAICLPEAVEKVSVALGGIAGVLQVITSDLGAGARVVSRLA